MIYLFSSYHILWTNVLFDLESAFFEVWLMQPSCLKDGIEQSLTQRFLLEISKKYSTYKFVEHFRGEVMDVVGHHDCPVKQVSKGHLAVASPIGTDGSGDHTLAQE